MMLSEVESWVADDSDMPEVDLGPPTDRGPPEGGPWGPPEPSLGGPPRGPPGAAVDLDDFLRDYDASQQSVWSTEADLDISPVLPSMHGEAAAATAAAAAATAAAAEAAAARTAATEAAAASAGSTSGTASTTAANRDKSCWPLLQREGFSNSSSIRTSAGGPSGGPPETFTQGAPHRWAPTGLSCCKKLSFNWEGGLGPLHCAKRLLNGSFFGGTFRGACRDLYSSASLSYLFVFVLFINAWVLLRWLSRSPVDRPLVAAEVFVSFMLIFEVSLRSLVLVSKSKTQ